MKIQRRWTNHLAIGVAFTGMLSVSHVAAQTNEQAIYLTKEEILTEAKKEGKVRLSPGHDKTTIPLLVNAFKKNYTFVNDVAVDIVSGTAATQRQLFELAAGKASMDSFSPHTIWWNEYLKQDLYKKYDFKKMVQTGQLKIPMEMIDDSGVIVWSGSRMGVIVYNTKLIPSTKAPSGWQDCLSPQWKGKVAVDTKPNVFAWLLPAWGEAKVLDFAAKLKANEPIWTRGPADALARLGAGEFALLCGTYLQSAARIIKGDATLPMKMVIPEPLGIAFHEPDGIYIKAKNPHTGLLWIEFLASREAQEIVDLSADQGRGSFLVEGTMANKLAKGKNVSICAVGCRDQEDKWIERIATDVWKFPKVK